MTIYNERNLIVIIWREFWKKKKGCSYHGSLTVNTGNKKLNPEFQSQLNHVHQATIFMVLFIASFFSKC